MNALNLVVLPKFRCKSEVISHYCCLIASELKLLCGILQLAFKLTLVLNIPNFSCTEQKKKLTIAQNNYLIEKYSREL